MSLQPECEEVQIVAEADLWLARNVGGKLADRAGLDRIAKHSLITAISELAGNILVHAGSGVVTLRIVRAYSGEAGIEVIAADEGGGIDNVELALRDGFSTGDGLGSGLPGVNRLMTQMRISSAAGEGTVVWAVKWPKDNVPLASYVGQATGDGADRDADGKAPAHSDIVPRPNFGGRRDSKATRASGGNHGEK